jgi:hypothetical protein
VETEAVDNFYPDGSKVITIFIIAQFWDKYCSSEKINNNFYLMANGETVTEKCPQDLIY